ncbi:MAG: hypothetical protein ACI9SC_000535 [Gammaproteobacteria bacterium]|jgi:hypothetical protein
MNIHIKLPDRTREMKFNINDSVALQRIYEKWVVKDEWLLYEEALPLLSGLDPKSYFVDTDCEAIRLKIQLAMEQGSLETNQTNRGGAVIHKVKPAMIYQWARAIGLDMPLEFSSLMEFVLKTVISADQRFVSNTDVQESRNSSDIEQILGACLSIVSAFPEECKNNRGIVKTERILLLLEKYSDRLFGGHLPELSSTVIRDIVNHWLEKLR